MDIKKIKPADVLGTLDNLVAKIPESIANILRNIAFLIFGVVLCYVAYNAFIYGYGLAKQEGHELARDTKSIFLEEIERDYNRKRKNIRMPSNENMVEEDLYKISKKYEPYGREIEPESIVSPESSLLDAEKSIRALKQKNSTTPLAELEDVTPRIENNSLRENSIPKRNFSLKDNFDSPNSQKISDPTEGLENSVGSKDSYYAEKGLDKNKKPESNLKYVKDAPTEEKKNRLDLPNRKKSGERGLLPIE